MEHTQKNGKNLLVPLLALLTAILMALTAICLAAFHEQAKRNVPSGQAAAPALGRHYALISDEEDPFWDTVYDGAESWAEQHDACVERFGENLAVHYTRAQRMEMAIAAGADGILLQADESEEMGDLIHNAVAQGIPVVTVRDDHYGGSQQSFVGLSNYDLGREYGRQIIRNATSDTKHALIIMNVNTADSGQNILHNGISETLANEGNHLSLALDTMAVEGEDAFGPEQEIRDLLLSGEAPEVIVCLNAKTTVCVSQTVVDLNMVGKVHIIGSYTNAAILNGIDRGVISSTVAVDGEKMGASAAEALDTCFSGGSVSDYVTLDVNTITKNNVKEYLKNAQ
jgi:ribose transport system substrate-binding protein